MANTATDRFEVIVVGGGPAGTTAAFTLANAGLKVALFERAEEPGQKNMFGGVLHYSEALNELVPKYWEQAPVERYVTKYTTNFLNSGSQMYFSFADKSFAQPPYNGFTLFRAKFDQWYAQKAQEAGVFVVTDTSVDDLIWDADQIIGVETGRSYGKVYADVVVAADGVNSLIAKKAGLRKDFSSSDFSVAAKEVLSLSKSSIEERFGLIGDEGVAQIFIGDCTKGIEGGAFLYTNRDSLSIGVIAKLSQLQKNKISIADLLEGFKNNPFINIAIRDATVKEYSGHLIPESGFNMIPQIYGNGILVVGDAAGFVCSTGLTLQGIDFAVSSGFIAGEAIKDARSKGDFSKKALFLYQKLLQKNFVLQDLKTFRHIPKFLSNQKIYDLYPSIVCNMFSRFYRMESKPRKKLMNLMRTEIKGKISIWGLIKDVIKGVYAWIWP